MTATLTPNFWQHKSLADMNENEWEALCDGCGKCCYRKYISGRGKRQQLHYTRIACNLLDLDSGKCGQYSQRFQREPDCTKLTKKNLAQFHWLPSTCAYRLLHQGEPLPHWHPLLTGDPNSPAKHQILIRHGIHEKDVIDWFDYVIEEP